MKTGIMIAISTGLALAACSKPMDKPYQVDGTRNAQFSSDLAHCKGVARDYRHPDGRQNQIAGALIGGAAGAIDAEDGDKLEGAAAGAAVGTLVGHLEAKSQLNDMQRDVVIRCMQNRGHGVVG